MTNYSKMRTGIQMSGRHERAARTARPAAVSVRQRRTMTNQANSVCGVQVACMKLCYHMFLCSFCI